MDDKKVTNKGNYSLSLVVPVFNEEDVVKSFYDRITPILSGLRCEYEVIFINDGSRDKTIDVLRELRKDDEKIKIIDLSRNFGKEQALTAGLDYSSGDAVIPMDVDLQDPPELICEMVKKWNEGFDVILAVREDRSTDSILKRLTANWFYRIFRIISDTDLPASTGDFRLMDRRVVNALNLMTERNRFMKGIFAWAGFRQTQVFYKRPERVAGETKWNGWRLWNFALDGIFSFSTFPLKIWTYMGLIIAFLAMIYMAFIVLQAIVIGNDVPGYPSLIALILFFNGIIMIGLGILGEYVGRTFIEAKQRPIYLVREVEGISDRTDSCTEANESRQ